MGGSKTIVCEGKVALITGSTGEGITVNCIEPGPTAHMTFEDALKAAKGNYSNWQQRDKACAHDVAETIAFLCSEAARFISGSTIRLPMA